MIKTSLLRQHAEEFLVYKRDLGYLYESQEPYLFKYVSYAEKSGSNVEFPTKVMVDTYLDIIKESGSNLFATATVLREFSWYLKIRGFEKAYIIPPKIASQPVPDPPYFFTEKEIAAFFEKLDTIEVHLSYKGREIVIPAIFRLLYCCGLRPKEARTLKCKNVHISDLYIDVLQSKGPKSRRIFINHELADYLKEYDEKITILYPNREYYFPARNGFYSSTVISSNFRRFWWMAFPSFPKGTRPRAYDFRHHFAWANINRWAAEGLDVNAMLPYLMRYMGHQTVKETLYYFHFVPEFFPTFREIAKPLEDVIPEVWHEN